MLPPTYPFFKLCSFGGQTRPFFSRLRGPGRQGGVLCWEQWPVLCVAGSSAGVDQRPVRERPFSCMAAILGGNGSRHRPRLGTAAATPPGRCIFLAARSGGARSRSSGEETARVLERNPDGRGRCCCFDSNERKGLGCTHGAGCGLSRWRAVLGKSGTSGAV